MHLDVNLLDPAARLYQYRGIVPKVPLVSLSTMSEGRYLSTPHNWNYLGERELVGTLVSLVDVRAHQDKVALVRPTMTFTALVDHCFTMSTRSKCTDVYSDFYAQNTKPFPGQMALACKTLSDCAQMRTLQSAIKMSPFLDSPGNKRRKLQCAVYCSGCDTYYSLKSPLSDVPPCHRECESLSEGSPRGDCSTHPAVLVPELFLPCNALLDVGYRNTANPTSPCWRVSYSAGLDEGDARDLDLFNAILRYNSAHPFEPQETFYNDTEVFRLRLPFREQQIVYKPWQPREWSISLYEANKVYGKLKVLPQAITRKIFESIVVTVCGCRVPFPCELTHTYGGAVSPVASALCGAPVERGMEYPVFLRSINNVPVDTKFSSYVPLAAKAGGVADLSGQLSLRTNRHPDIPRFVVSRLGSHETTWSFGSSSGGVEAVFLLPYDVEHSEESQLRGFADIKNGVLQVTRASIAQRIFEHGYESGFGSKVFDLNRVFPKSYLNSANYSMGAHLSTREELRFDSMRNGLHKDPQQGREMEHLNHLYARALLGTHDYTFPQDYDTESGARCESEIK